MAENKGSEFEASIFQLADELETKGMSYEAFVQIPQGRSIAGRFVGIGASIVTGFPVNGVPPAVRLPVVALAVDVMGKDAKGKPTGEVLATITVKALANSSMMSQLARCNPGDLVKITHEGKVKTRGGFEVKKYVVASKRLPDAPAVEAIAGFHPPAIAMEILRELPPPSSLSDVAMPAALPAIGSAPALPAAS